MTVPIMTQSYGRLRSPRFSPVFWQFAWTVVVASLVALVASTRPAAHSDNLRIIDLGRGHAWAAPALWIAESGPALIGQSDNTLPGLIVHPLNGSSEAVILPYTDFAPQRWQVTPSHGDTFHIVWLEQDGRLRSALVQTTGQTVRGPIELSAAANSDFAILQQPDGAATVIWTAAPTHQIVAAHLDSSGRPGPIQTYPSVQGFHLAAARERDETIFVIWLVSAEPRTWSIKLATLDTSLSMEPPATIGTITLAPDETISTTQLGLTLTHATVIIGINRAEQPDTEQVLLLTSPIEDPLPGGIIELRLPWGCTHEGKTGQALITVPGDTSKRADIRWPRTVPDQRASLPVALACRTADGWNPVIVTMNGENISSLQKVAATSINASPPALTTDAGGQTILAWTGLARTTPHLFVTTLNLTTTSSPDEPHPAGIAALLRGLAAGVALGWMWLLLPTVLLWRFPHNLWTWPMALTLFGAAQLLWPGLLFERIPAALLAIGLDGWSPTQAVGITLLAISMIAGTMACLASWRGKSSLIQWLVFGLVDTLLVWAIFGTNLM